jgi:hypothetical protein
MDRLGVEIYSVDLADGIDSPDLADATAVGAERTAIQLFKATAFS